MSARRIGALATLALLGGLGAWAIPRLRVEADITHFLPATEDRQLAELSRALTSSDLNRTVTLTVGAPDRDTAAAAARELGDALEESDEVAWVRAGPDDDLQEAFYEAYFPRRLHFITDERQALEGAFTDDALRARARRLKEQLASPTGTFVRRIAPEDPWLLFLDHVQRLRGGLQGDLEVHEGAFVTEQEDGVWGVVLLASRASPFDGAASRHLLADLDAAFAEVNRAHGGELVFEQAGVHRIAVRSERLIRADIQRVSVVGTIGVVLLLLLLFRSPRLLVLGALPLAGGMVVSVATVQLVFGRIHGLTLAFGATLIGVALDYVAHLLNHDRLASAGSPEATAKRIWPGLALGAATTVAGLAGLAWTSFPGIRQMAVFTSVGVATALLLTRFVLPPLMPTESTPTRLHRGLAARVSAAVEGLASRRRALWALPVLALVVAALGLPRLSWIDDIRALNPTDPTLVAEDERVRGRVARMEAGRFAVATGDDLEAALVANDALHATLAEGVEAGELERTRSLHPLLWSAALQRENRDAIPDDAWERTVRALEAEDFVAAPFAPFREALEARIEPLRWADLEATPLGRLAGAHRMPFGEGEALLTFVSGVRDPAAVQARVDAVEGARWFDQNAFMQAAYRGFRTRTLELVGVGLFAVFLLVFVRYRRPGLSLAAFAPALVAAGATLGVLGLLGLEANLLHVVTLLLVLSMGVDYGVFMVEAELHAREGGAEDGPATIVSLLTACLSTVASFGVLAMSANPALRAMGLTAAIGVLLSLLLAPTAWILVRRPDRRAGSDASSGDDA